MISLIRNTVWETNSLVKKVGMNVSTLFYTTVILTEADKLRNRRDHYSGIGGQAVLEGIMMKNKEQYAVAVRKPNGEIEVEVDTYHGIIH